MCTEAINAEVMKLNSTCHGQWFEKHWKETRSALTRFYNNFERTGQCDGSILKWKEFTAHNAVYMYAPCVIPFNIMDELGKKLSSSVVADNTCTLQRDIVPPEEVQRRLEANELRKQQRQKKADREEKRVAVERDNEQVDFTSLKMLFDLGNQVDKMSQKKEVLYSSPFAMISVMITHKSD